MLNTLKHDWKQQLTLLIFLVFAGWWTYIQIMHLPGSKLGEYFSDSYGLLALIGSLFTFFSAQKWGGFKSVLGRAIIAFSMGLFAQAFGQIAYSYYAYILQVEAPYPSLGDIGYFGSIVFYIYGLLNLAKAAGAKIGLKSFVHYSIALIIPAALLAVSYWVFLIGYDFNWNTPLTVFLDFGYPLGQALYLSLGILIYILSFKLLGGIMKNKILFLLLALAIQYVADYMFLYEIGRDIWKPGDLNDFVYLVAYVLMILALLQFNHLKTKRKS